MAETTPNPHADPRAPLAAITPLGGDAPRRVAFAGFEIVEVTDRALASVAARRGQGAAVQQALSRVAGCAVPGPGGLAIGPGMSLFWAAPEQWFVDAPLAAHPDLAAELQAALGPAASVTEQTDGWARFDIEGPGCAAVLERLCAVDVRAQTGPAATRTVMEHVGAFLLCQKPAERFAVLCLRSYAGALHHALLTAARSAL